jgi:hypothetical protein
VLAIAEPVRTRARTPQLVAECAQLVAFGNLLLGRVAEADRAIAQLPAGFKPHPSLLEMRAHYGAT